MTPTEERAYMAGFREAVRRCSEVVKHTGAHLRAALDEMTKLEPTKTAPVGCPHGRSHCGHYPHCLGLNDIPTCHECGGIRCRPLAGYVSPNADGLFCPNCGERAVPEKKNTPG